MRDLLAVAHSNSSAHFVLLKLKQSISKFSNKSFGLILFRESNSRHYVSVHLFVQQFLIENGFVEFR